MLSDFLKAQYFEAINTRMKELKIISTLILLMIVLAPDVSKLYSFYIHVKI